MVMMRALVWLLLLGGHSFSAQTDEWKTYKNTDGNFSVLFPGEPKDTVTGSDPAMQSHTLLALKKPAGYMVVYVKMADDQKVDEPTYQIFRDGVFKELASCGIQREGSPMPALRGYVGHGYKLACQNLILSGNLYWGKHHAYAVMGMYATDAAEPADLKRFVDSFELLDPAK